MRLLFIGILACFLLAQLMCESNPSLRSPVKGNKNEPPSGWQLISTGTLSFYAPPDMKQQKVRATDEVVLNYSNGAISLDVSYGPYPGGLSPYYDQPEYHQESIEIDGRKAKIAMFRLGEMLALNSPPDRQYIEAIQFDKPWVNQESSLIMWAECKSIAEQEIAKKIFLSTTFQ